MDVGFTMKKNKKKLKPTSITIWMLGFNKNKIKTSILLYGCLKKNN